jgi:hypothetical protein
MAAAAKDLLDQIDFAAFECLNAKGTAGWQNAVKQGVNGASCSQMQRSPIFASGTHCARHTAIVVGGRFLFHYIGKACTHHCHAATCNTLCCAGYRDQDELFLESDADEQLLLNVTFNQKVKLQVRAAGQAWGAACMICHSGVYTTLQRRRPS